MFRFLSLSIALFLLFAAAWVWITGDTRPIQLAHWKNMIFGNSVGATTANVAGTVTRSAPKPAAQPAKVVKLALSRVGSPSGRYVSAKPSGGGTKGSSSGSLMRIGSPLGRYVSAPMANIKRIGSPTGRYVKAPTRAPTVTTAVAGFIKRIGSPLGRYVVAPAMAAPVPKGIKRISSPGGRYVKAPKVKVVRKPAQTKFKRVSSPGGRYVTGPKTKVTRKPSKYTVVGSPGGRYVSGPKTKVTRKPSKYTVVGSPGGRYVSGPKTKVTRKPSKYTVVGSPGGRYVKGPASVPAPRKTASGALVFPITFEYPDATFTPSGLKAADQLLAYIRAKKYTDITLSGHTDSRGKEKANLILSEKRLEAVVKHLRDKGYKGNISIIPKGESQPDTSVDRSKYSQDELYGLDRRVELVSGG